VRSEFSSKSKDDQCSPSFDNAAAVEAEINSAQQSAASHRSDSFSKSVRQYIDHPDGPWSCFSIANDTDTVEESEEAHRQAMAAYLASIG